MIALQRLAHITQHDEYDAELNSAHNALTRALDLEPMSTPFRFIGLVFDWVEYSLGVPDRLAIVEDFTTQRTMQLLRNRYPRFVMPSGRIERDLAVSRRSNFYHLQNLKDLLMLNSYLDDPKLERLIRDGIAYVCRTEMVHKMAKTENGAVIIEEILLMAASQFDDEYIQILKGYLEFFERNGFPISVDTISFSSVLKNSERYTTLRDDYIVSELQKS
jgi:hypothetical protein